MTCSTATSPDRPIGGVGTRIALLIVVVLALAACSDGDGDGSPSTAAPSPAAPSASVVSPDGCSRMVGSDVDGSDGADLRDEIDSAVSGDVICVGPGVSADRVEIAVSGTVDAPITVRGIDGVGIDGFDVGADHVVIEDFRLTGRGLTDDAPGVFIEGNGVVVRSNTVTDPDGPGIACSDDEPYCTDVVIEGNTIAGADGSGIVVHGSGVVVAGNDISGSIREDASDADGIRFFGSDIEIVDNHVHDISDEGYVPEEDRPHTDCFQTFDNDRLPTVDVTIHRNTCDRVDHQCLVAEAVTMGRSTRLRFAENVCRNGGSQGILLRGMQDVTVVNNLFLAPIEFNGIVAEDTSLTVVNNAFIGSFTPYFVRGGDLVADHDLYWDPADPTSEPDWAEPNGIVGSDPRVDPSGSGPLDEVAIPAAGSPLIDAGDDSHGGEVDLAGRPRIVDGDGDGDARIDIGAVEVPPGG